MTGTTLGPYRIDRELGAGGMGKAPAQHHASMLTNVRVNREIVAAAKEPGM